MKISDIVRRSGRNLRSSKIRTILTALAIAIGAFTLTVTLAASQGARNYAGRLVSSNFDPNSVFVAKDKQFFGNGNSSKPKEYSEDLGSSFGTLLKEFNAKDIAKIKALPDVKEVIQNYNLNTQFITRPGAKRYTGALNVYDAGQKPLIIAGQAPEKLNPDQTLLPDDYLTSLNFSSAQAAIGQQVTIQVRQLTGITQALNYSVVGVTTTSTLSLGFNNVGPYISEAAAANINSFVNGGTINADHVPTLLVRGNGITPDGLKSVITAAGYEARTSKDLQGFLEQIINVLQTIIIVFGVIGLIASLFGVINTQYISVLERTREIGLMKALGMSRRNVSRLFMIEATWIGLFGGILGSLAAFVAGTLLNPWVSTKLKFGSERLLVFKPLSIIALLAVLMLVTTIAGLLPARKAAKLDPIEALRTE